MLLESFGRHTSPSSHRLQGRQTRNVPAICNAPFLFWLCGCPDLLSSLHQLVIWMGMSPQCVIYSPLLAVDELMGCSQMLNSLGQNPCEVTANLMGTCYDGSEF